MPSRDMSECVQANDWHEQVQRLLESYVLEL